MRAATSEGDAAMGVVVASPDVDMSSSHLSNSRGVFPDFSLAYVRRDDVWGTYALR